MPTDEAVCEHCGSSNSEMTRIGASRFSADVLRIDYRCRDCGGCWNVWE